jgi:hypothetical protein
MPTTQWAIAMGLLRWLRGNVERNRQQIPKMKAPLGTMMLLFGGLIGIVGTATFDWPLNLLPLVCAILTCAVGVYLSMRPPEL